jgi:hypothetical protein
MSAVTFLLNAISRGDPETSQQPLPLLHNELLKLAPEHLTGPPLMSPISCNRRPHNSEAIAGLRKENPDQTSLAPDIC